MHFPAEHCAANVLSCREAMRFSRDTLQETAENSRLAYFHKSLTHQERRSSPYTSTLRLGKVFGKSEKEPETESPVPFTRRSTSPKTESKTSENQLHFYNFDWFCQKFWKGVGGQRGLARGNPSKARDSGLFSVPFFLCPLRRRGTHFWGTFWALFGGFVCRQPLFETSENRPRNQLLRAGFDWKGALRFFGGYF